MTNAVKTIDVFDPTSGSVLQVPASSAERFRQGGYAVGTEDASNAYKTSGVGGAVIAGLTSAASGASFHLADSIGNLPWIEDQVKPLVVAAQKQHNLVSGAAEFLGGVVPYLAADVLTGGVGTPAVLARIATGTVGSGIEAAVEASKTNSPLTAEQLTQSLGMGLALSAGAEGLGKFIQEATPAIQRGANKYLRGRVDAGFYEPIPKVLPLQSAAEKKIGKAAAFNAVNEAGGAAEYMKPSADWRKAASDMRAGMAADTASMDAAAAAREGPPSLPGEGLPSYMQPTEEEAASFAGQQGFKPDSKWHPGWERTDSGETWQQAKRATAAGVDDPAFGAANKNSTYAKGQAWTEYKTPDSINEAATPDAPPIASTPDNYQPEVMTDRARDKSPWNLDIEPADGNLYRKKGDRPFKTLRAVARTASDIATGVGTFSWLAGNPAGATAGYTARTVARGIERSARALDDLTLATLNRQVSLNATIDKTITPFMRGFGKLTRQALEAAPVISDHAFGGNNPDKVYEAVQTALPKYATDPNSLNQYYEQKYGHVFQGQDALYQNFINTNQQAMQYLHQQLPKDPRPASIIPAPFDPPRADKIEFLHKLNAINDPMTVLQNPTAESVAAVSAVYPETMKLIRTNLLSQLQARKKPLSAQEAAKASLLLGQPVDGSVDSQYLGKLQLTASGQAGAGAQQPSSKPGPKPKNVTIKKGFANISAPASQQNEVENAQ